MGALGHFELRIDGVEVGFGSVESYHCNKGFRVTLKMFNGNKRLSTNFYCVKFERGIASLKLFYGFSKAWVGKLE